MTTIIGYKSRLLGFVPDDPRLPLYRALRIEWMQQGHVTPKVLELESQIKDLTATIEAA